MEAKSVEDNGASIMFNVYCYNVQPEVTINYSNGDSSLDEQSTTSNTSSNSSSTSNTTFNNASSEKSTPNNNSTSSNEATAPAAEQEQVVTDTTPSTDIVYITDTGKKYHNSGCRYLNDSCHEISKADAEAQGYEPCKVCH